MKNKKSWMILALAITLVLSTTTGGWAYLVDTGPGPEGGYTWSWLQHDNLGNYTYNAAEFTLSQESTITSIEGWIQTSTGGSLRVRIYNDGGELPGTTVLGSQDFSLLTSEPTPTWHGTSGLNWTLLAGTYWVAFEMPNPGFKGYMYSPSTTPW